MNPFAAVQNDSFATSAFALLAWRFDVARLIMICADKAVNPESIMDTSKHLAERVLLSMPASAESMGSIRLGNTLGSEGSVVPRFLKQIARGGPVTVTDPDMTVQRVLAGAASRPGGGAIAIPARGAPIRIVDRARFLIEQASAKDLEITHTGLAPDDRLQEQFPSEGEAVLGSPTDGVQWIDSPGVPGAELAAGLPEFNTALDDTNLSQLLTSSRAWCRSTSPAHVCSSQPAFPWLIK